MHSLALLLLINISLPSLAFPTFLKKYSEHPQAKEEFKKNCGLCHIAPEGGGERNEFGMNFAKEGAEITKELIEKYPNNFKKN